MSTPKTKSMHTETVKEEKEDMKSKQSDGLSRAKQGAKKKKMVRHDGILIIVLRKRKRDKKTHRSARGVTRILALLLRLQKAKVMKNSAALGYLSWSYADDIPELARCLSGLM